MIMNVYSVYDNAAEAYLQPFFTNTKGTAIRSWTELVNDKEHQFGKYPSDYVLFELGTYDDTTGALVSHDAPKSLGVGVEFVREA